MMMDVCVAAVNFSWPKSLLTSCDITDYVQTDCTIFVDHTTVTRRSCGIVGSVPVCARADTRVYLECLNLVPAMIKRCIPPVRTYKYTNISMTYIQVHYSHILVHCTQMFIKICI